MQNGALCFSAKTDFLNKSIIIYRLAGFVSTVSSWVNHYSPEERCWPQSPGSHTTSVQSILSVVLVPGTAQPPSPLCCITTRRICSCSGESSCSTQAGFSSQLWSARLSGSLAHGLGIKQRFGPGSHPYLWLLFSIFIAHCISQFSSGSFTSVTHIPAWGRNY